MLVWYSMMTLMAEALQAVDIRLRQIIAGEGTPAEVFLMVTEKMDAAAEARTIFLRGSCLAPGPETLPIVLYCLSTQPTDSCLGDWPRWRRENE